MTAEPLEEDFEELIDVLTPPSGDMSWQEDAACQGYPINFFVPEKKGGKRDVRIGKRICGTCPVKDKCLDWVLDLEKTRIVPGVYGGTTSDERRRTMRRCHLFGCKKTIPPTTKHGGSDFCSEEHSQLHKQQVHENRKARLREDNEPYYKQGTIRNA